MARNRTADAFCRAEVQKLTKCGKISMLLLATLLSISTCLWSGCGAPDRNSQGDARSSSGSSVLTRKSFDTPAEIFRLSIKAIKDRDIDKFKEYHLPEIRDKIEKKAFDEQAAFFRTHSPVIEVTGENVDEDQASIDFSIKVEAEGKVFKELDSTRLRRFQGEWKISSF